MTRSMSRPSTALLRGLLLGLLVGWLAAVSALAASFPEITAEEKALGNEDLGVPAVVLFEKADLRFADPASSDWTEMEVWLRLKLLTDEGVASMSDVEILHSRRMRLRDLEARTVLPDGRVVEAGDDAVFRDTVSGSSRIYLTKVAMPAVEVGAILDVHYVLTWPDVYMLSPYYFDNEVPTMLSELTYHKPDNLGVQLWWLETAGIPIQKEERRTAFGAATRVWMERVPPIPDEPYSFPDADLANRFMVIPRAVVLNGQRYPVFEDWEAVSDVAEDVYRKFMRGRQVKAKAKALASAAGGDARGVAEALFRFVRDEIRTDASRSPLDFGDENGKGSADDVLEAGRGSALEKSLLLVGLLDAVKIEARPVWAASRLDGRIDVNIPNPSWFDWPMVAAEIGRDLVFLDPADPGLTFGQVAPSFEGMPVLVIDDRQVEIVEVPFSSHQSNQRLATSDLVIDEEGRLTGTGRLELTGARAWAQIDGDEKGLESRWEERLAEAWPGFEVTDVTVTPTVEEGRVVVEWALAQRDEEVLGDEASLVPSRPILHSQPFTLPPEQRLTPVQFHFAARDEVRTTLRWPEGWSVEQTPRPADVASTAGLYKASCEVIEAERRLTCGRIFERHQAEYAGKPQYTMLQQLYESAAKVDPQAVVLFHQ